MPGDGLDGLEGFEAMVGAFSNLGKEEAGLGDARCPKCGARDFVSAPDLYSEAVRRVDESGDSSAAAGPAGMTDAQILGRFSPPRRRTATARAAIVAVPLAAGSFFIYQRFGAVPGQFAIIVTIVLTVITYMTTARRLSDEYYDRRTAWNRLYICRQCGQAVKA
jgi:DNA-directed RNA polymerase subunit RPC12/RpoP